MYSCRTDLALERHARLNNLPRALPGLDVEARMEDGVRITQIDVTTPAAARAIGKP